MNWSEAGPNEYVAQAGKDTLRVKWCERLQAFQTYTTIAGVEGDLQGCYYETLAAAMQAAVEDHAEGRA